jgi:hypothetical protein
MKVIISVAALIVVAFVTVPASANSAVQENHHHIGRSTAHWATQHRLHVVRRDTRYRNPTYGAAIYGGPTYGVAGYGPGYNAYFNGFFFVPGNNTADEACNLPSSHCWNEQRDVNY